MSSIDLGGGVRKMFLLGVGAVATTAEKGTQVINDLVEKGELTVQQGKALNEELTCKARQTASDGADALLRARLSAMTPEERAAYAQKVAKVAADLDAEPVTVEVEADVASDVAPEPATSDDDAE